MTRRPSAGLAFRARSRRCRAGRPCHECEGRKATGLSVDGALHLALADAQARGHHGVLAGIYKDREWPPVAEVWVPLEKEEEAEATLRRLVRAVSE